MENNNELDLHIKLVRGELITSEDSCEMLEFALVIPGSGRFGSNCGL